MSNVRLLNTAVRRPLPPASSPQSDTGEHSQPTKRQQQRVRHANCSRVRQTLRCGSERLQESRLRRRTECPLEQRDLAALDGHGSLKGVNAHAPHLIIRLSKGENHLVAGRAEVAGFHVRMGRCVRLQCLADLRFASVAPRRSVIRWRRRRMWPRRYRNAGSSSASPPLRS